MLPAVQNHLAVDVADAQSLKAKAASGDRSALVGAAKQFESLLVAQMLKTMRQTRFSDEDDPMTGGDGMKLYQELLDQQLSAQITKGRGLGFADMMVKAMERNQAPVVAATDTVAPAVDADAANAAATPVVTAVPGSSAPGYEAQGLVGIKRQGSVSAVQPTDAASRREAFLARMRPHAEAAAEKLGVPAEFILAHAALESGWGQREITDAKGQPSHNLFGIKAGRSWDGAVAETTTTEYRQGVAMKLTQPFRAYDSYESAFMDYANLIQSRYSSVLGNGGDASAFARGLAAGGYATDPAYADKLQSVISKVVTTGGTAA